MTAELLDRAPSALPQYPALFIQYILRSVHAARAGVEEAGMTFPDEVRDRALHVLSFALHLEEAWPAGRDLLLALAPKMEMAGHRDDWLPYLQQGLAGSQQANDALAAAELQLHIGHLYRLQSQFEPARRALEASVEEFAKVGNANGQARTLNQLARMAWHQRQFPVAQRLATTALALLPDTDPERAAGLSTLGLVAVSWYQWQEAKSYFENALQIYTDHSDQRRAAWNLQHLGNVSRNQGDYVQAARYYEKAIHVLTTIQDWYNCAITQMEFGIFYWLTDQPAQALALYDVAEAYFRKSQDFLYLAKLSTNQGLGHLTLEAWQKAIQRFKDSADLYQTMGDRFGTLNALDGLGLAYEGLGAYDEAIAVFETALDQLSLLKDDPNADLLRQELTAHLQATQAKKGRS
ncbi:MAG: tetratricopeptide repeat protein [Caldilineaceae bacterium]|nr:tetratricopeptide repeat protein [Caldilineaceae bacterium]